MIRSITVDPNKKLEIIKQLVLDMGSRGEVFDIAVEGSVQTGHIVANCSLIEQLLNHRLFKGVEPKIEENKEFMEKFHEFQKEAQAHFDEARSSVLGSRIAGSEKPKSKVENLISDIAQLLHILEHYSREKNPDTKLTDEALHQKPMAFRDVPPKPVTPAEVLSNAQALKNVSDGLDKLNAQLGKLGSEDTKKIMEAMGPIVESLKKEAENVQYPLELDKINVRGYLTILSDNLKKDYPAQSAMAGKPFLINKIKKPFETEINKIQEIVKTIQSANKPSAGM